MSFKDELNRKIRADRLARRVIGSLGPVDSGRRIDKPATRALLEMAGYDSLSKRAIEMYALDFSRESTEIIVLDNELKIFKTTVADVELRRNPTTREMISFRNIRKILNDQDVVISRGAETARKMREQIMEALDLSYTPGDVGAIASEGIDALEADDPDRVQDVLEMFAEMLRLLPPPPAPRLQDMVVYGWQVKEGEDVIEYGPVYIFSRPEKILHKYDTNLSPISLQKPDTYRELLYGRTAPDLKGREVFEDMQEKVLALNRDSVPIDPL